MICFSISAFKAPFFALGQLRRGIEHNVVVKTCLISELDFKTLVNKSRLVQNLDGEVR
jgi:hypothetical protein